MYEGTSKWRGMTKEDKIFVRKYYERFGQSKDGMSSKSFYIQSVIGDAENQYYDTIKSFSEIKKL